MGLESSSWGRVVGALATPSRTFRAIAERPSWWPPLIVLVACDLVLFVLVARRTDFEAVTREVLAEQVRQLDAARVAQIARLQEAFGWLVQVLGVPLLYGGAALVLWVTFRLLGGELGYWQSLGVTLHAFLPSALASLLAIRAVLPRSEVTLEELEIGAFVPSNLAGLAPADAGVVLHTFLASLDLFSLWTVALLALGFALAAKVPRLTAWSAVLLLWLVYILGRVGLASVGA